MPLSPRYLILPAQMKPGHMVSGMLQKRVFLRGGVWSAVGRPSLKHAPIKLGWTNELFLTVASAGCTSHGVVDSINPPTHPSPSVGLLP
jgi:hypothetical protein